MTVPSLTNTQAVTVIIPSNLDTRMDWLKHRLIFLYRHGFQGEVLLGIWSGHGKVEALLSFCRPLSANIRVVLQDGAVRFTERILALAEQAAGQYVIQTGDDDFLIPDALDKLVVLLAQDASIACAQGRTLSINSDVNLPLQIYPFPVWPALETDTLSRYAKYCVRPGQLFHAMFRRADFIDRYRWMDEAMAKTKNEVWFESIGEFYGVIKGRFFILDEIFILRGKDPTNASRAVRADARQFPLFLLAEDFSPTYKFFEGQLFRLLATVGVNPDDPVVQQTVQAGMLNILGAAVYGRREPPPPEETKLLAMLQQQPLHPTLERIIRMVFETKVAAA